LSAELNNVNLSRLEIKLLPMCFRTGDLLSGERERETPRVFEITGASATRSDPDTRWRVPLEADAFVTLVAAAGEAVLTAPDCLLRYRLTYSARTGQTKTNSAHKVP
jgi:hypothetical protein